LSRKEAKKIAVGTLLKVTPAISPVSGYVVLDLEIEAREVKVIGNDKLPVIKRRSIKSTVEIAPGKTLVISGLYQEKDLFLQTGIPVLKNIPIIGRFFRKDKTEKVKTNLSVFVTPSILLGK